MLSPIKNVKSASSETMSDSKARERDTPEESQDIHTKRSRNEPVEKKNDVKKIGINEIWYYYFG